MAAGRQDGLGLEHLDLVGSGKVGRAQRRWPRVVRAAAWGPGWMRSGCSRWGVVCQWWDQALEW
ncbi:hypothetical protein OH779_40640 [Actinacidiphila glaucinigra]|uniref:hypothetical protein n=1 Tax=Actinacidiphila glaucinigra TaxID=235986 RepID=UPI00386C37E2